LRLFDLSDARTVDTLAGVYEVAHTTQHIPYPYPEGAAEEWITRHPREWASGEGPTYAVTLAGDGTLVGAVGLSLTPQHVKGELGYWIGVPYWGQGYATEAARALVDFGFTALGLHRVEARCFCRNPASGRVLQKLGMALEGTHRESVRRWERFEDVAFYGVLAREWTGGIGA
ncbi:MAG TPA: GNAT family N-acetyltransferase, partial [Longimicrobium sp.]|nr:GNAT family N-acetyltransferase [Longimicrobium sp.]